MPWQAPQSVLSDVSDSPGYRQERAGAAQRSGVDESIVTGEGLIGGHRVAVVCSEFSFLAGSIGRDAAGRVLAALQRATTEGLPVIAAPASGGTRMQEGTPAFLRMVSISNAVTKHKAAGLPYLVYLRHPVTGGVLASWGSLGHLTFAEPGALVGFLGPKVYRALTGIDFPRGVQIAENLYEHGIVDAVVTADEFAATVGRFLSLLRQGPGKPDDVATYKSPERPAPEAWHAVESTRLPERPGVVALIRQQAIDVVELSGSGEGNRGGAVVLCLARFGSSACVVVGQDRAAPDEVPLNADSLATARRGMRLAAELGLPLVTVVDTPGAVLSPEAEEAGLAGQIARCLADLGALPVPTLSVLLGQGCGGGALALLPADRVLAAENAWLTPLPPEGASAIVHGTPDRAPELAAEQRIHSIDLLETGAVDRIVPEQPDASREPETFLRRIARAIDVELADMPAHAIQERIDTRMTRWHSVGL
ncbi:carboxyl transferase domain-containing protein [Halopolyspora algeriensis]|uniref:carboxyl transferase domain-containing protein n=1 Tax=Halopolyspora algeriensis TaxID=1500506 RepID=UPI000DF42FDA